MEKHVLGIIGALLLGALIGGAAAAALNGILAGISVDIVPGTSGGGGNGGNSTQASGQPLVTINLGSLEAGKSYRFEDAKAYAWLNTDTGGPVTFSLDYNNTVFDYVRIEINIHYNGNGGHDDGSETKFYLDTGNPSYTVNLPANANVKVDVEVKQVSVSPGAQPGHYTIQVLYSSS